MRFNIFSLLLFFACHQLIANDYYVHPTKGDDTNSGLSKQFPLKTLASISKIKLEPGDRVLLASNQLYTSTLGLINQNGTKSNPILITSINWDDSVNFNPAIINFKGAPNGILIQDCSFIEISNIKLTANGFYTSDENQKMRCAILVNSLYSDLMEHLIIDNISIYDVFYENTGFIRGTGEVKTANGTQKYGWGIRVMNDNPNALIKDVQITNCNITNVSHTGIKLTGSLKNIANFKITNNILEKTGGPGIQMSGVKNVYVAENFVKNSGSNDDSRKWGRGSGLWTWGSSHVLIEKNQFLYANGPGDSAGAHIDFNCDNIIIQYNLSAFNAGGFCEILGNNYNCIYRYNISINDGHRVKGIDGAFQEGKILWLSGYQGEKKPRKGPVNSYFYNNTIYSDSTVVAKIAIDNTSSGILIANNIFYLKGKTQAVLGDQYKPETKNGKQIKNVLFSNNLFLNKDNWPSDLTIADQSPILGDPVFANQGGVAVMDYIPKNHKLIKGKGINITLLPNDSLGLLQSLNLEKDILGTPIVGTPSLGAIVP